jgi:hypothetical protein
MVGAGRQSSPDGDDRLPREEEESKKADIVPAELHTPAPESTTRVSEVRPTQCHALNCSTTSASTRVLMSGAHN